MFVQHITYFAEMLPTVNELVLFKYMDRGEKKKLEIINGASHKWKDIASLICDNPNMTNKLEQEYRGNPNECLRQTFINYFISKKPQGYTQDWNGVIELLEDVGLQTLSENVKDAVSSLQSGGQQSQYHEVRIFTLLGATIATQKYMHDCTIENSLSCKIILCAGQSYHGRCLPCWFTAEIRRSL